MVKPCCETGEVILTDWKLWTKRVIYLMLAVIVLFLIGIQITN